MERSTIYSAYTLIILCLSLNAFSQEFQFTEAPENYRLYARDKTDSANVVIAGQVDDESAAKKLVLKVYKDGNLYDTQHAEISKKKFRLSSNIHAGLHQFSFELYLTSGDKDKLCFSADSVVCGDAYIISGQSNSHASSSLSTFSSPYCRSFGVKTGYESYDEKDKEVRWGRATGDCPKENCNGGWFVKNNFGVGVWGMELMKLIVEKHQVPVCIINGGSGSSSIEQNMLYPEQPSLETSFGRLAYRVHQAGLKDKVKAILWHQGETNSNWHQDKTKVEGNYRNYSQSFDILLSDWQRVYTGLQKIYLFQLHPGCGGAYQSDIRQIQHELASSNPMIDIMSTTGVVGHDGCHFSYEGYKEFAGRIFPLVSRDFYGEKANQIITPPKLVSAQQKSSSEVVLTFDQPIDAEKSTTLDGETYLLKDYFYFYSKGNEEPQGEMVEKIIQDQNQLTLTLKEDQTFLSISWLPNQYYSQTKITYSGPWIRGASNELGALSFHKQKISPATSKTLWHGFKMLDSTLNGRGIKIVFPHEANEDRNWIWRARFWGHEPQTDIALLEKGFHLVYIDVGGLFGNEEAIRIWEDFYEFATQTYGLNRKVVLEGMSRGGLIVYNWGNRHADKVASIYADAPVCDVKSWPGGKGNGKGAPRDWEICKEEYGFSESMALAFNGNPIDHMENIARYKVPIIHVVGDDDVVVPVAENTALLEKRLEELGWEMTVIHKPGIGHHPHSLTDPTPIVSFIMEHISND